MFKPTYLYIKTHNITGLKYFGKTTNKDPYKYKGSGTYWKRHLEKHGCDVNTEILGYYINEKECKSNSLKFSKENNIVDSKEWANLKVETLDGGWEHIGKDHFTHENSHLKMMNSKLLEKRFLDKEFDIKYKEAISNGLNSRTEEEKKKWITNILKTKKENGTFHTNHMNTPECITKRKITYESIKHQQGEKNSQFGTTWIWCKEEGNKKIKKEVLQEYLNKGWEKRYIPGYSP